MWRRLDSYGGRGGMAVIISELEVRDGAGDGGRRGGLDRGIPTAKLYVYIKRVQQLLC